MAKYVMALTQVLQVTGASFSMKREKSAALHRRNLPSISRNRAG